MEGKLLVVDDELFIRELLAEYFTKLNYQVKMAATAAEALRFLETDRFQVALVDLRMPETDGIDLLGRMKPLADDLPIILMTGYPTIDSVVSALREGAHDYIIKPFRLKELGNIVARAIMNQRHRHEIRMLKEKVAELESSLSILKLREPRENLARGHKRFTIEQPLSSPTIDDSEPVLVGKTRRRINEVSTADPLFSEEHAPQREFASKATPLMEEAI